MASSQQSVETKAIEARYRQYCDACQAGQLDKLTLFWSLPASFAVHYPQQTKNGIINTSAELAGLYSHQFGPGSGVDQTVVDSSEVTFYGEDLATIQTSLRHLGKGELHDTQTAIYGCQKIDNSWWFTTHISKVELAKQ